MGRLSRAGKDRALTGALGGPLYVGLATARREDGALVEERDKAYRRQVVTFGEPSGDGVRAASSRERLSFDPYENDARAPLRYWFVSSASAGAGDVIAWGELTPRFIEQDGTPHYPLPLAGEAPFLLAGDVTVAIGDPEED